MRIAVAIAAFVMFASGCTAVARADTPDARPTTTTEPPAAPDWETVPDGAAYIASVDGPVPMFHSPGGVEIDHLDPITAHGTSRSVAVIGVPEAGWAKIHLDQRPNNSTAWVRTADVRISWTQLRIELDLDSRQLRLWEGDDVVLSGEVAIGKPGTPTPRGSTYVTDVLATPDPDSLYGPFALGLAMYSDTVTEYAGGDGQIGIHGTNSPHLLGHEVSMGCARVHNDVIRSLAGRVPLGTPVTIV